MRSRRPLLATFLLFVLGVAGCGGGGADGGPAGPTVRVLLLLTESALAPDVTIADDLKGKLSATGAFAVVDVVNPVYETPSAATLAGYDVVLVDGLDPFQDATALGNALASFANDGGGVVLGMLALNPNNGSTLGGAWVVQGLEAIETDPSAYGPNPDLTFAPRQPPHPILSAVGTFDIGGIKVVNATPNLHVAAVGIATWDWPSGLSVVAAAVRTLASGGRRVDLNFHAWTTDAYYGESAVVPSTDGVRLVSNALLWAAGAL